MTDSTRAALVIIPHGFGLDYNGNVYGVNANRLTKNTHRVHFRATPLHRYVPCLVAIVLVLQIDAEVVLSKRLNGVLQVVLLLAAHAHRIALDGALHLELAVF